MQTLFSTLVAFWMTLTSLKAQENILIKAKPFQFGVFAGFNYSSTILTTPEIKSLAGFLIGVDLQYAMTTKSSLHLQPSWTRAKSQSYDVNLKIGTFKLPFIYRYNVSLNQKLFFVQAGVSYNHLTGSGLSRRTDIVCIAAPCPYMGPETSSSIKSVVSGMAGIGYTIELGKISIPITLQYDRNLSNYVFLATSSSPFQTDTEPIRVKFESFALTTGISF
ncbi:outer membrane beta-barrel protein [Spirosoma foliorum]|uniref:Outer membrane beta-barrel protein n=1 Tax=Spirosoma foliorum TaxID=2710596 RepID=A0A7G5H3C8_9BACT|nr:outer membrane beta-barrel protein [Spirosoma foliorum]QMW05620.1 outer membrane beta-barrel protein [Spirosoma foliorum]